MSNDISKKVIHDLKGEIEHNKQFQNRYEKLVTKLGQVNEEE